MSKSRDRIPLIVGVVAMLSILGVLIGIAFYISAKKRKEELESQELGMNTNSVANDTNTQISTAVEQVKKMQTLLLNIGINNSNNKIIDAIQLTGGIDGIMGNGFNLALKEAIENGYVDSLDDLRNRIS